MANRTVLWGVETEAFRILLQEAMSADSSSDGLVTVHTLNDLWLTLLKGRRELDVVVLVPASPGELEELRKYRTLLDGLRLVVALPDTEARTVSLAHQLYPRFVVHPDTTPGDITAVLARMHRHRPAYMAERIDSNPGEPCPRDGYGSVGTNRGGAAQARSPEQNLTPTARTGGDGSRTQRGSSHES